jgi:hypothetical protein
MIQSVRIASAAIAAALLMSCASSESTTSAAASCSGDSIDFWGSAAGQAEIDAADLAYLATYDACGAFGAFGTAGELAAYLVAGAAAEDAGFALCAQWFAFALNARNARFLCDEVDVLFQVGGARFKFCEVETAVDAALTSGQAQALADFLAEANSGGSVCVCERPTGATGGTGGNGGTGSWGE